MPKLAERVTHPVLRSEGQRQLLLVQGSLNAIARACGGGQAPSVHEWRTGKKIPSMQARVLIESALGIPRDSWTKRPAPVASGAAPAVITPAVITPGPAPAPPPPAEPAEPPPVSSLPSSHDECLEMLAAIREDRRAPDLGAGDRCKLIAAEARILQLRARFESAAELAEDRYVRDHPAWQRLQKLILGALEPHPLAAKAVRDAITAALRGPTV